MTNFKKPNDPEISVILPCYNSHKDLQQALDSLSDQTFDNFEVILVNDGSNDPDTLNFIDNLNQGITVIHQANHGLSAARNTGVRNARGTYILPLDCDDWLDPSYLSRVYDQIRTLPDQTFVFTQMRIYGDKTGILRKNYNHFEQLFFNQLPYCLFMPKSVWSDMGGYDETMGRGYEDWEYNIRLGRNGYHGFIIPEPLFNYRISQTGMLKSISQKLHGVLWRSIQKKNHTAYTLPSLYRCWKKWRHKPSTYPLYLFFGWYVLHKALPNKLFNGIFKLALKNSLSIKKTSV